MQTTRQVALWTTIAALWLAAGVGGQQAPVFKAETNVVPIDLVVTDQEGRPLPGLRAEDFQVTVDGQPRKVVTAQFLSSAATAPTGLPGVVKKAGWDIDAAFDTVYAGNTRGGTVDRAPSRNVMIAIDQSSFSVAGGRTAARAARGVLDMLHPNDRVGLAVFPPPGPYLRPTLDHQRVRQALGQVSGSAEQLPRTEISLSVSDALLWTSGDRMSRDEVSQRFCSPMAVATCGQELDRASAQIISHARGQALASLRGLADIIRGTAQEDAALAVVVVSTGMFASSRATLLGVDGEVRDLGRLAAVSRAMVYALHVDAAFLDLDTVERQRVAGFANQDEDLRLEGLRYLAGATGGTITRVGGGGDAAFRRVSLDLSAYYLLGVESAPGDRDGRRHRIRVSVARPGASVRTREDLYVPVAKKLTGDEAVKEALEASDPERALPIRLSTQMLRESGTDKVRLLISAFIGEGIQAAAAIRVGYRLQGAGAAGTVGFSDIQTVTLPVIDPGPDGVLSYLESAQLTPGRYLLRLAAADEKGRVGSVQQVVDATLVGSEAGTMSDVILVDPSRSVQGTLTPVADGRVAADSLESFLEIYPAPGHQVASVTFDVSDSPGGPTIVSGSVKPEARGDRLVAGARLELRALPPGVYMLNARVLEGDRVLGRTSRPFLIDRPAGAGEAGAGEPRAALAFAATGGLVRSFSRENALRADALTYFLNRLQASDAEATGQPLTEATEALRGARFGDALAALPAQSDLLSVAFLKGLALFGQGELPRAAEQFRQALRINSEFLPAAFYLGACYAAGGRDREAVGAWQTSLVSETDSRLIYEVLADALLRLKDGRQAETIIQEARERWPDDETFTVRLAAARVILDQRGDALALLAPYIERHQDDSEALFLAIRLLYEAHDSGKRLKSASEDRALAAKYGALYAAAGGSNGPLVARWVGAMTR